MPAGINKVSIPSELNNVGYDQRKGRNINSVRRQSLEGHNHLKSATYPVSGTVMSLWSCDEVGPESSAETQLRLPAPLRNVMEADEDNVIHFDVEGADSPLPIGPHLHRLLAHGIHELLDASCDYFGQLCFIDHATIVSVISRRDLFVARLVAWPLEDHQSLKSETNKPRKNEIRNTCTRIPIEGPHDANAGSFPSTKQTDCLDSKFDIGIPHSGESCARKMIGGCSLARDTYRSLSP